MKKGKYWLLFRQPLAFTAKGVRKRNITNPKSICEANLKWILACYWNGVNSNNKLFGENGGNMEKKKLGLWISKALIFASVFTLLVLLVAALLMYKADISMDTAGYVLILAYIGAPFLGALYLGKKVVEKRYLWGLFVGICYFLLFLVFSLCMGGTEQLNWVAELRVLLMALAGGVLGGMLS